MNNNTPYRHEVRSKLRTQFVKDKSKYDRKEQREILIQLMHDAEEIGLYEDQIDKVRKEEIDRRGNNEGGNFIKTQLDYKG